MAAVTLHEQTQHLKWQENALHAAQISDTDQPAIDGLMENARVVHRSLQQFWGTAIPEADKRTRFVSALKDQRKIILGWTKKDWRKDPTKGEKIPTSKDAITVAKHSVIDPLDKSVKVWTALEKARAVSS